MVTRPVVFFAHFAENGHDKVEEFSKGALG